MPSETEKRINLRVAVAGEREFEQSVQSIESHFRRIDENVQQLADRLKSGFNLEALAKAGMLVSAAINAADIATKALSGNIQDAAEAVKKLPLGVGQMATALEGVLGQWSGIARETEYVNQLMEAQNKLIEAGIGQIMVRTRMITDFREMIENIHNATEMIGLAGFDRERKQEGQSHDKAIKSIQDRLDKALEENNRLAREKAEAARQIPVDESDVLALARQRFPGRRKLTGRDMDAIREEARMIQQQRFGETIEADRAKKEADLRRVAQQAIEAEQARHAKVIEKIERDAFSERIKSIREGFDKMLEVYKDGYGKLQKAGQEHAKAEAERRKLEADAARTPPWTASESRFGGVDWGAIGQQEHDPMAAFRRKRAALIKNFGFAPNAWDFRRQQLAEHGPFADQVARKGQEHRERVEIARFVQEQLRLTQETNRLLERMIEENRHGPALYNTGRPQLEVMGDL